MAKPLILITRTQDEAARTAAQIEARGGEVLIAPLRTVEAVFHAPPQRPERIIATSANAFGNGQAFAADWLDLPVLTVGDKTAQAAEKAGFRTVESVDGDAQVLVSALEQEAPSASFVYLAGEPRKATIEAWLEQARIPYQIWLRYRMVEASVLPVGLLTSLREQKLAAALHFSTESALSLIRLCRAAGLVEALRLPRHICLSASIAATLAAEIATLENLPLRLHIANRPRADAMIEACFASFEGEEAL